MRRKAAIVLLIMYSAFSVVGLGFSQVEKNFVPSLEDFRQFIKMQDELSGLIICFRSPVEIIFPDIWLMLTVLVIAFAWIHLNFISPAVKPKKNL